MSRSWRNSSYKPPVGFVYFDPDSSQSSASRSSMDTSDFLSFGSGSGNDSPRANPMLQNFSPINCSSPRMYSNKMNYRSPRQRFYSPFSGRGQRGSWRNTQNVSGKEPGTCSRSNNFKSNLNSTSEEYQGASVYFDPTCLQDPWLELREEYEKKRNEILKNDRASQEQTTNESSLSSSQSEDESDLETKQP